MKRLILSSLVMLLGITLAGCGAAAKTIAMKAQSERMDVFQEISGAEAIPAGYADLTIQANIKTHVEGYYMGESKETVYGKSTYPFLINIDGQAIQWKMEGKAHQLPKYVEGKTNRDPEAGDGIKYVLEKRVRLAAGAHKVFLGLPEEPFYTVADIIVQSGGMYVLQFKPQYRYKTLPTRIPTFFKGVDKHEVVLNGSVIR